jgi:hypothetical protein
MPRGESAMKILIKPLIICLIFGLHTGCNTMHNGGAYSYTGATYYPPAASYTPAATARKTTYLGNLSANQFAPNSTANPFGAGNQYRSNGIANKFSQYGNRFSNKSFTNPYATNAPKLYDSHGNYRGRLSANRYDPDSISNPYGKYGNRFSPDSINNPFGAGNPFNPSSPTNPFGSGLKIYGQ